MASTVHPATPAELAERLRDAAERKHTIALAGNASKRLMAGPSAAAGVSVFTRALDKVLAYEPNDLTISVQAGMRWAELTRILAANRQMVPLDPPFAANATVGGVIAANCSGPRRRLYGTARDLVIGMQFATLEGKLVQSGGMVVKNVAGLDMGKLMIGSFGTLAAIAVVNFKVIPQPAFERTFLLPYGGLEEAVAARDAILKSALEPAAIDLLNAAAVEGNEPGYTLAIQTGGNAAAIARYERDLAAMGARTMRPGADAAFWRAIRNFTPGYLYD